MIVERVKLLWLKKPHKWEIRQAETDKNELLILENFWDI